MPPIVVAVIQLIATYGIPAAGAIIEMFKKIKTVDDITPEFWAALSAKVQTPYEEFLKGGG